MRDAPLGHQAQPPDAVLADRLSAHEDRVAAAAPRLEEVRPPLGHEALERRQDVARRERHPRARARRAAELGRPPRAAPPAAARRPTPSPAIRAAKSGSSERRESGTERPWNRFQVSTRRAIAGRSLPRLPRHLLTGAELSRDDLAALLRPRGRAEGGAALVAGARGPDRRARVREAEHPHARVVRGRDRRARRPRDGPARRRDAALARRVGEGHRARALAPRRRDRRPHRRGRDPRGARRRRRRPGLQHAHRRPPPVPGARRPA